MSANNSSKSVLGRQARHALGSLAAVYYPTLKEVLNDPNLTSALPRLTGLCEPKLVIKDKIIWQCIVKALINKEMAITNAPYRDLDTLSPLKTKLNAWLKTTSDNTLCFNEVVDDILPYPTHTWNKELSAEQISLTDFLTILYTINNECLTTQAPVYFSSDEKKLLRIFLTQLETQITNQLVSPIGLPDNLYHLTDLHDIMLATNCACNKRLLRTYNTKIDKGFWSAGRCLSPYNIWHKLDGFMMSPAAYLIIQALAHQRVTTKFEEIKIGAAFAKEIASYCYGNKKISRHQKTSYGQEARFLAQMRFLCNEFLPHLKDPNSPQFHPNLTNAELLVILNRLRKTILLDCKQYNQVQKRQGQSLLPYLRPYPIIKSNPF